jgi:hypothetical protein
LEDHRLRNNEHFTIKYLAICFLQEQRESFRYW